MAGVFVVLLLVPIPFLVGAATVARRSFEELPPAAFLAVFALVAGAGEVAGLGSLWATDAGPGAAAGTGAATATAAGVFTAAGAAVACDCS